MYNYDDFHATLDTLLRLNREHRDEAKAWATHLPALDWAEDFCTVTCDIGRRTGKTEWIKRTATEEDLIVVPDLYVAQQWYKGQTRATVVSARTLDREVRGRKFKTVFVDEPRFVFEVIRRDEFYSLLAVDPDMTFVLLGVQWQKSQKSVVAE